MSVEEVMPDAQTVKPESSKPYTQVVVEAAMLVKAAVAEETASPWFLCILRLMVAKGLPSGWCSG